MNGIFIPLEMLITHYLVSLKTYSKAVMISMLSALSIPLVIPLSQIPVIISIIGSFLTVIVIPAYVGWKKYRRKQEEEKELHAIKLIIALTEAGFILPTDTPEEKKAKVNDWKKTM